MQSTLRKCGQNATDSLCDYPVDDRSVDMVKELRRRDRGRSYEKDNNDRYNVKQRRQKSTKVKPFKNAKNPKSSVVITFDDQLYDYDTNDIVTGKQIGRAHV